MCHSRFVLPCKEGEQKNFLKENTVRTEVFYCHYTQYTTRIWGPEYHIIIPSSLHILDGIDLNLVKLLPLISQVIPMLSFMLVTLL